MAVAAEIAGELTKLKLLLIPKICNLKPAVYMLNYPCVLNSEKSVGKRTFSVIK